MAGKCMACHTREANVAVTVRMGEAEPFLIDWCTVCVEAMSKEQMISVGYHVRAEATVNFAACVEIPKPSLTAVSITPLYSTKPETQQLMENVSTFYTDPGRAADFFSKHAASSPLDGIWDPKTFIETMTRGLTAKFVDKGAHTK